MIELENETPVEIVETDDGPKYTPDASTAIAVHNALHQHPVEFEKTIHSLLADKLQNAVEKKREEVARSIFGDNEPEVGTDNVDQVEDAEETASEHEPDTTEVTPEAEEVEAEPEAPAAEEEVEETPAQEEVPAEE